MKSDLFTCNPISGDCTNSPVAVSTIMSDLDHVSSSHLTSCLAGAGHDDVATGHVTSLSGPSATPGTYDDSVITSDNKIIGPNSPSREACGAANTVFSGIMVSSSEAFTY